MAYTLAPTPVTLYHTPADAAVAQVALLADVATATEVWLGMFALSWGPLLTALGARAALQVAVHLLVDASQAARPSEQQALRALSGHAGIDLTRSTAGADSPHMILHDKVIVLAQADGSDLVWTGALNLTAMGWHEANTVTTWRERQGWARTVYLPWWQATQAWAAQHVPQTAAAWAASLRAGLGQEEEG